MSNSKRQTGAKIKSPKYGHWFDYAVNFHQDLSVEQDRNIGCRNYPNKDYETYQECDKQFIKKTLKATGWNNLTPILSTDIMDEVNGEIIGPNTKTVWVGNLTVQSPVLKQQLTQHF